MVIIVPHRIIWSWYTGRSWVGCYIWYSEEGSGRGCSPPMPLLAVLNATAYPSAASVPIITLLYNGPLNCGFNVRIKGLKRDVCYKLIRLSFDCLKHSKSDRRSWVIINLINTHANVHRTPMTLSVGRSVTQSHRLQRPSSSLFSRCLSTTPTLSTRSWLIAAGSVSVQY